MKFQVSQRPLVATISAYLVILTSIILLYFSQTLFPRETYQNLIAETSKYDLVNSEVVTRAPTGWGADRATECLSLGMGLKPVSSSEILLNYYPNIKGSYNPCEGLIAWSSGQSTDFEFTSYARYWHGHSEILRWGTLLFGVPVVRALLALILISLYFILGITIYRTLKNAVPFAPQLTIIALLVSYYLSGAIDLHNSMTHVLSEITILIMSIISLRLINGTHIRVFSFGFAMGGAYVTTSYMINPQSIPVAIISWSVIPLLIGAKKSQKEHFLIWRRFCFLFSGIMAGYIALWMSKWILIDLLTSYPIWNDVLSQAQYRSSQSVTDLSSGVSANLSFAQNLPAPIQAILANMLALGIKIWDPRFASLYGLLLILIVLMILFVYLKSQRIRVNFNNTESIPARQLIYANTTSLLCLFGWYAFMAQHSFDHATYTYRSLSLWTSGLILSIGSSLVCSRTIRRTSNEA